jgi:hypothetical protein
VFLIYFSTGSTSEAQVFTIIFHWAGSPLDSFFFISRGTAVQTGKNKHNKIYHMLKNYKKKFPHFFPGSHWDEVNL